MDGGHEDEKKVEEKKEKIKMMNLVGGRVVGVCRPDEGRMQRKESKGGGRGESSGGQMEVGSVCRIMLRLMEINM